MNSRVWIESNSQARIELRKHLFNIKHSTLLTDSVTKMIGRSHLPTDHAKTMVSYG
jgi:hypothetical protein